MNYLQDIEHRKGIYWCYRNEGEIHANIRKTLCHPHDCLVEIPGFDRIYAGVE